MLLRLFTISVALLAAVDARPRRLKRASVEKPFGIASVSGWSYQGCMTDGGAGALTAQYQVDSGMTLKKCTAWCQESGFTYAGLDIHDRCSCDNTIRNSLSMASNESSSSAREGNAAGACNDTEIQLWKASPRTATTSPTRTRHVARAATTTGTYVGCFKDSSTRILSGSHTSTNSNTASSCASYCSGLGYKYGGTENGDQCWCGNSLDTSLQVDDSNCSKACTGDSSEKCGAAYRISVYYLGGAASYQGCFKDSSTTRILSGSHTSTSTNTASSCASYCSGLGYKYGGTENGDQCWCGNSLDTSLQVDDSVCSKACTGDSSEKCGAAYRISVYCLKGCSTTYEGCYKDSSTRILSGSHKSSSTNTASSCASYCSGLGYKYGGTENGDQCWCGNSLDTSLKVDDSNCSKACTGDSSQTCGAAYRLSVYCLSGCTTAATSTSTSKTSTSTSKTSTSTSKISATSASAITTIAAAATTTTTTSTTTTTPTTTAAAAASSSVNAASASVVSGTPSIPSSSDTKYLFAHHMVGNTYSFSQSTWADDISMAASAGIDGFALNYGSDSWQAARIASAYAAAEAQGSFKLFLSMDVTSLSCSSASDASNMASTVATYASHSAQAKYKGKVLLSTFSGADCTFGQGSAASGWTYFRSLLSSQNIDIYFVPALFSDTSTFSSNAWMEGEFNWNSGWPMGSTAITTESDTSYMSALSSKKYMAAVSPCFFTYYSPSTYNKDWIYRSDDWLLATRMEQMVSQRASFDLVEIISWNDFGESHYIGPIRADQPNSQGWTNGMPHTAWLTIVEYYASAFKSGSYGNSNDQMVFWTRPHPKAATPSAPTCGRPTSWNSTDDLLYVWVALKSAATVTVTSGSNTGTWTLGAGVNKISISSGAGVITGKIVRSGSTVKSYSSSGSFSYTNTPTDYNYNYFVASV